MFNKNELVSVYESALATLIEQRTGELKFYVIQEAFSHMSLSVAFWHYDMYWNLWEKPGKSFTKHDKVSNGEFIILSDFEKGSASIKALRDIFSSWEDDGLVENEDENMELLIKLAHEALARALNSARVKSLLLDIFSENEQLSEMPFQELVRVEDVDGHFDINFMAGEVNS
ncbi:hypothetical protein SG34_013685 [Thalassomonas viridans]|uniref:Uncharacterized protein n=1 Tax=Thalassomonas viridans TaxID=137584 RepID=A0AAE9Z884_9GAMM|nr:hypothetical protein [Thalassomonas viridans]WDE07834.1 hypothetical protein SG34_013685 [Thalassomonas viridans]